MNEHVDAYPLSWPPGWRRTSAELRTRAKFNTTTREYGQNQSSWVRRSEMTIARALRRVFDSLQRMGLSGDDIVISSNLRVRLDGMPASSQREPSDPGVAVYWRQGKATRCMAIDRYDRVADNLAAIAATLEAMRAIERHGGAEILDRAFTGFTALPAPEQWWQVLNVTSRATRDEIDDAYRKLAFKNHPDRGGDAAAMARINAARDQGYEARA